MARNRPSQPGLAALAMRAGGSRIEIDGELDAPIYLGLDWFLLDLFVFALVFVPLERLFPRDRAQRVLGLEGDPVPEGYLAQLAYPFRQASASTR